VDTQIDSIEDLLDAIDAANKTDEHSPPNLEDPSVQQRIEDLKFCLAQLREAEKFSVGDIIRWRPLMCNRRGGYGEVFIVVDVLDEPIFGADDESGSTYFREPLDIIAGKISGKEGAFITFHYDSRRFTKLK